MMMTKDEARAAFEELLKGLNDEEVNAMLVVADTDTMSACMMRGNAQTVAALCLEATKYQINNAPEEFKQQLAKLYRDGIMDITSGHINRLRDLLEGTMRELNKGVMN